MGAAIGSNQILPIQETICGQLHSIALSDGLHGVRGQSMSNSFNRESGFLDPPPNNSVA